SRRRHTRLVSDWSSDVCSSDLLQFPKKTLVCLHRYRRICTPCGPDARFIWGIERGRSDDTRVRYLSCDHFPGGVLPAQQAVGGNRAAPLDLYREQTPLSTARITI